MSKSNYLNRVEIKKTLKDGRRFSVKGLIAVFSPSNHKSQVVVIVSKKIATSSVKRNTIKRRFREAFNLVFKNRQDVKYKLILICHSPDYSFKECVWHLKEIINFISKKKNGYLHKSI